MARRLFFVEKVRGEAAELQGEEARHLRRVLRAEIGQRYELSDNQSRYLAEIDFFGKDLIRFRVLETLPDCPPPVRLTVLISLIKFDRLEWVVEKGTELGVERIVPVVTDRSEKGLDRAALKRIERWRRIVLESSQQCRRVTMPLVDEPLRFADAIQQEAAHRYFLEERPGAAPLFAALPEPDARHAADSVALLTGPEGGWTDAEREMACRSGWTAVSLGRQVLRAETAAIAALAVLSNAWLAMLPAHPD